MTPFGGIHQGTWLTGIARLPTRVAYAWARQRDYLETKRWLGKALPNGFPTGRSDRTALIMCFGNYIAAVKMAALLGRMLRERDLAPVVITQRSFKDCLRYFRLFGIHDAVFFDEWAQVTPPTSSDNEVERFLAKARNFQAIKALEYRDVFVGRHALSGLTRTLVKGTIDLQDPEVQKLLPKLMGQIIRNVDAAEQIFDRFRPDLVLVNEIGYPGQGEIYEVGLQRGINTVYWDSAQKHDHWIFKRYTPETKHVQSFSLSDPTWDEAQSLEWTPERETELRNDILSRYDTNSGSDSRQLQLGKRIKTPDEVRAQLGLNPARKTAVIFSHITWDASFFYGADLFDGYEEWLVQTVLAAVRNPSINWIVKLHPANLMKLQSDGVRRTPSELISLRKHIGELPSHVKLLPSDTDINTLSLFDLTDYCLTVRGTIGIEMACYGIPVFTAGTGRYTGRGFTIDSGTKEEYMTRLARIQETARLTPGQIELAKKHAYWLFMRRQVKLNGIRKTIRDDFTSNKGHPLATNLVFDFSSASELVTDPSLRRLSDWIMNGTGLDYCVP